MVDYAERWDTSDLLTLLSDARVWASSGMRVRILLLARPASTWWLGLRYRIEHDLDVDADALELGPVATERRERMALFTAARDRFAQLLRVGDPEAIAPPAALEHHEAYRLVLAVHMAALAAVLATEGTTAAPTDPVQVSAFLLARERDQWQALHARAEQPLQTSPDAMAQTVYTAILAGPLPHTDALTALQQAGVESAQHPGQLLKDHATCYPPPGAAAAAATALQPLYPDRLGEDFIALTTPGHDRDYPADPWAATAITRLLSSARDPAIRANTPPVWTRPALATLVETARRWAHVAEGHLYPVLRADPRLALDAGGPVLAALAGLPGIDIALLEAIEAVQPAYPHADLDIGIAMLAQRLAEHRLAHSGDDASRARIYYTLAFRLANAGLYNQALTAAEQAVEVYRQLAAANPATYEPELARSRRDLGVVLSKVGRREEALAAEEQAVEVYRRLAAANPAAYEPQLAWSLANLGLSLSGLGQHEEALAAADQAVEVYRRLAAANPATYEPELARSLMNLGVVLSGLGRHGEALAAEERAVEVSRRLAAANPAAYEPQLAWSLASLGLSLSRLGQYQEALAPAGHAVEVFRRLAAANPAAYEPELASSLTNLAGPYPGCDVMGRRLPLPGRRWRCSGGWPRPTRPPTSLASPGHWPTSDSPCQSWGGISRPWPLPGRPWRCSGGWPRPTRPPTSPTSPRR